MQLPDSQQHFLTTSVIVLLVAVGLLEGDDLLAVDFLHVFLWPVFDFVLKEPVVVRLF